jgi:hypothetical protein
MSCNPSLHRKLVKTKRIKRNGVVIKTIRTYKKVAAPAPTYRSRYEAPARKRTRKVKVTKLNKYKTVNGRRVLVCSRVLRKTPLTSFR